MSNPAIRFSQGCGLPYDNWVNVKLSDVAKRISRKNSSNETNIPLTISSTLGLVNQLEYFTKKIASTDMSKYFLLKKGEFAYNKSYSLGFNYGSIKRLRKYDNGALSSLYICFNVINSCPEFMEFYFDSLKWYSEMSKICGEGARNHGLLNVSPKDFFNIAISIPKQKEEQEKIAKFFSFFDEKISLAERKLAALEKLKAGLMQKIFSRELRFKRVDGSSFPDWEWKSLKDIGCEFYSGQTPNSSNLEFYGGDIPWVASGDLNKKLIVSTEKRITEAGLKDAGLKILKKGSFLISLFGLEAERVCGNCGILGIDAAINQACMNIKTPDCLNVEFLYIYYLYAGKGFCRKYAQGTKQQNLNVELIEKFTIPCPSVEEQQKIVDFISLLNKKESLLIKENQSDRLLKQAFMQQMFV